MSLTHLPWSILWTFPWCNLNLFTPSQAASISQYFYQLFKSFSDVFFFLDSVTWLFSYFPTASSPLLSAFTRCSSRPTSKFIITINLFSSFFFFFFFSTEWPFLPLISPIRLAELLPVHSQYCILPFLGYVLYLRAGPCQCVCQSALANGFPLCEANGRQWRKTVKWEKIGSQL